MLFLRKAGVRAAIVLTVLVLALSGCEKVHQQDRVNKGDRVQVQYACRSTSGELVATSDAGRAKDASAANSPLFFAEGGGGPISLVAGPGENPEPGQALNLRRALLDGLAEAIVGVPVGEKRTVNLTAEVSPGLPDGERFLEMARVRRREKEKTMSTRLYGKFRDEGEPEVGQQVVLEPGFTGTVTSMSGDQVTLRVETEPGIEVDTLLGKGTIHDRGDHYEIEIDARKGSLVRMGNLVGKISSVDEALITVDFGHPFGGEVLVCDVELKEILMKAAEREPKVVRKGDRVKIDCEVTLEDGSRLPTPPVEADGGRALSIPETLVAGMEKVPLGIGDAVLGMAVGERKAFTLTPYEAYGPWDPEKTEEFPCVRREPRRFQISTEEYARRLGSLPEQGAVVSLLPYFETRVVEVSVGESTLEHLVTDGTTLEDDFGRTSVRLEGEEIVLTLEPRIGAPFAVDGREGWVASTNGRTFTVDYNHPLAGKALRVELEVASLTH